VLPRPLVLALAPLQHLHHPTLNLAHNPASRSPLPKTRSPFECLNKRAQGFTYFVQAQHLQRFLHECGMIKGNSRHEEAGRLQRRGEQEGCWATVGGEQQKKEKVTGG
jgi:hypothetical protein